MQELVLFPPEATQINLTLPDGSRIVVDALDIDDLVAEALTNNPEAENIIPDVAELFKNKYGVAISKHSTALLIMTKHKVLEELKKSTSTMLEPSDSSTGLRVSQTKSSSSSKSVKNKSKQ